MVTALQAWTINVGGQNARVVRGGKSGALVAVFLHSGIPGVTPFCGGDDVLGDNLANRPDEP
jgi:hypothetical protein